MKKIVEFTLLSLLMLVVSCTKPDVPSGDNDPMQIESFKLNAESPMELPLGDERMISYSIRPRELQHVKKVKWTSSKSSVVSVSGGLVKGLKEGQACITAEVDGFTASINIKVVYLRVKDFNLPSKVDIFQNHTTSVAVTDIVPDRISSSRFTWKIIQNEDDPVLSYSVEKNNGSAELTGLKTGTATVQVTADDITKSCQVSVKPRICESLAINTTSSSIEIGKEIELEALVEPEGLFKPQEFKWTSSAPEILKLSSDTGNKVKVKAMSIGIAKVSVTLDVPGNTRTAEVEMGVFDPNYQISVWASPYPSYDDEDVTDGAIVLIPHPNFGNCILICDTSGTPLSDEIQRQCTLTFPDNDQNLSAVYKNGHWRIFAQRYCKNRKYKVVVEAPNGSQATFTASPNPKVWAFLTISGSNFPTNALNTAGTLTLENKHSLDLRLSEGDKIQFYYYLNDVYIGTNISGLTAYSGFTRKGTDRFDYDAYFVTAGHSGPNSMTVQIGDLQMTLQVECK